MESTGPDARLDGRDVVTSWPSIIIGGLRIDTVPLEEAVGLLSGPNRPRTVHLCNAYTVALADRDSEYRKVINGGRLNLADGMPVVWVAKRRGHTHLADRCSGPDLMRACLLGGRSAGLRHFLYGSTTDVLNSMRSEIRRIGAGIEVVGVESPPFRELSEAELDEVASRIDAVGADVVWVGLGTPKQDFVVERLSRRSAATFVAIGAAFDFIAGAKKRAPRWMQRTGLEWAYRLALEPRRLWRRYLVGNVRFILVAMRGR